ncbi:MAG: GtrA family protein [Cyanobacteria bacterium RI_101]|jgi:putative flippase GtrA|nr:GtrA family protein [Cyanobacteria bacterium RI_101]
MTLSLRRLAQNTVARWWLVGLLFMVINIVILDWLKMGLGLSLTWATVLSAEFCTLTRYAVNDTWVFGNPRPTWKRCWDYHLANFSSFFLWSFIIVVLGNKLGWDHRLAAVAATVVSVGWSMVTNFLWVWRRPSSSQGE